ncbi:hypothetical protein [Streptomyces sp. NRRL S-920]|uniref:hypothetical protein n=1 Tax=Streptomyces sp. NRRL S-920 TaxID=1463921 RepID=UPI0004CBA358|nr:hypothetical protein [Streptomyces sp. NRRL S-920]
MTRETIGAADFNRRVRLLVEVPDHPDELALAEELLVAEGCVVRAATAHEAARVGQRRAGLVVEVRLRGARRGARRAAVHRVERLAERRSLALWVRESTLCTPPRERRTRYHVRLAPPTEGSPVARRVLRLARYLTGDAAADPLAGSAEACRLSGDTPPLGRDMPADRGRPLSGG